MPQLRRLLALITIAVWLASPAAAQTWPSKPVHFVVPYPAGGPADALGRLFGAKLAEAWGQPVIIDNRAGASGNIAARLVAKAPPDGSTFLLHSSSLVINVALYKEPGYDAFADFTPISRLAGYMLVLVVHPSLNVTSVPELVAAAKARPGAIAYKATADGIAAATLPDIRGRLEEQGLEVIGGDAAELARASRAELDHWSALIKSADIHAD